ATLDRGVCATPRRKDLQRWLPRAEPCTAQTGSKKVRIDSTSVLNSGQLVTLQHPRSDRGALCEAMWVRADSRAVQALTDARHALAIGRVGQPAPVSCCHARRPEHGRVSVFGSGAASA